MSHYTADGKPCRWGHGPEHRYRQPSGQMRCRLCFQETLRIYKEKTAVPESPRQRAARRGREARAKIAATLAAFGLRPVRGGA